MAYTTIDDPTIFFNTITWSGVDGSDRALTGVGFQPDWVWSKARTDAYSHVLFDAVRGAGSNKELYSDLTQSEGGTGSTASNGFISSFDSDGFSTDNGSANTNLYFNASGKTYVAWNWLAGGSASSNSDGSITSSVSANTTAGFSIVSFTGTGSDATVGHGLNVAPDMVIVKSRDAVRNWGVYHRSLGGDDSLKLNLTDATTTSLDCWNDLDPTSSVVHLGTTGGTNVSGEDAIMYCFHSVKGYSKFGSFTGTSGDEFIYTGFKPAFVLTKRTDGASSWYIWDNKRNPSNLCNKTLEPNNSNAEATSGAGLDFLSNGFVERSFLADAGRELIYIAFAESPFVNSNGVPNNAR